ncbi:MAG TPA: hypothetical protein VKD00_01530, partial [Methyloceanibacter sp.]|nr:hypothetical protein [Methyloceanibacter sp.]
PVHQAKSSVRNFMRDDRRLRSAGLWREAKPLSSREALRARFAFSPTYYFDFSPTYYYGR